MGRVWRGQGRGKIIRRNNCAKDLLKMLCGILLVQKFPKTDKENI